MRTKTKPKPVYAISPLDTVFAFDVSSTATGWAWGCFKRNAFQVMGFNVIRPKSGWDAVKRIDYMVAKIGSYVAMYAPALIVMEYQSHKSTGKHVQGLSTLELISRLSFPWLFSDADGASGPSFLQANGDPGNGAATPGWEMRSASEHREITAPGCPAG